jgi:replication factor A2
MQGSPFGQAGSPSGRRGELPHSLRPLTISQLSKASQLHAESEWKLDDLEVGQITLVGQVISSQKQTTNHVYVFDDGTGSIEGRKWIADSSDGDDVRDQRNFDQKLVRVFGGLKSFGKKRYLNINHIRLVSDPHEIFFHILEAITVSLIVERGPPSSNTSSNTSTQTKVGITSTSNPAYSAQTDASVKAQHAHLPELERRIVEYIRSQTKLIEGVHVSLIARAVAGPNDPQQISSALDNLMEAGVVFTTIDDSHFQLT